MRALLAVPLALLGFAAGMVADVLTGAPPTTLAWAGGVAGAVGGWLLARRTWPKDRSQERIERLLRYRDS